jgi:SAM-dependent methyltransferase
LTRLYREYADLYDIAFDWDLDEEAVWLVERLGADCRSVLEPGCGSGRMLEALRRHGLEFVGLDNSPAMVELAARRVGGDVALADIADFDLGRVLDGAVCPINTLAHLSPAELVRHLECMGRHLRPGGRYLVQLALRSESTSSPERPSRWETERGGTRLRVTWQTVEIDLEEAVERQLSRIEVLDGDRAGEVVEEEHRVTAWSPHSWTAAVAASPFRYSAAYDGDAEGRPGVEPGTAGRLIWHELTRR